MKIKNREKHNSGKTSKFLPRIHADKRLRSCHDTNRLYDLYMESENNRLAGNNFASAPFKSVIVFPNYYETAMSNLGFLRTYELINLSGIAVCHRAFIQDDVSKGIVSIETRERISSYDMIFFSLSYENDFINILSILDAEKIPFFASERDESSPLIMAGGVIAFLNPEPVAPFFDIMFSGEAEGIIQGFLKYVSAYGSPSEAKKNKRKLIENAPSGSKSGGGIYVPSAYKFNFDSEKPHVIRNISILEGFPKKIKRITAGADSGFSSSPIITPHSGLSSVGMIEIERGCKRGCRFCSAGYIYLPWRESEPSGILDAVKSLKEGEKPGFVGLGTLDGRHIKEIMEFSVNSKKPFSLSSIRLDCLDEKNLELIKDAGIKTVTLGVETGSSRLRKLINKDTADGEIISAVRRITGGGIMNIKAYFMFGLPVEDKSDIDETILLIKNMRDEFISASRVNRKIGCITASFAPFVPKAWTPLQWESMENESVLKKKSAYILNELRGLPNLEVKMSPTGTAWTEAFFAKGSRLCAQILAFSYKNKAGIKKSLTALGYNQDDFIRKHSMEEILPWDIIDQGVTKKYLMEEYKRGMKFKTTPQCFEGCKRCGVCR